MSDYRSSLAPWRFDEETEEMTTAGFDVLLGDDFTLLLDLDGDVELDARLLDRASELFGVQVDTFEVWTSKSGPPNRHARVKLVNPATVVERIALQAMLGSDPMRELLSLARLRRGVAEPVRLFKPRLKS